MTEREREKERGSEWLRKREKRWGEGKKEY